MWDGSKVMKWPKPHILASFHAKYSLISRGPEQLLSQNLVDYNYSAICEFHQFAIDSFLMLWLKVLEPCKDAYNFWKHTEVWNAPGD